MFKKRLTLKILLFLVLSDILETAVHFCFKKSALGGSELFINKLSDVMVFLRCPFSSAYLWLGIACAALTFIIWSTILSKIDLSVAVPVASFSYILVPLVSIIFLGEQISLLRWLGISCIIIGIIFVSLSSKEKVPVKT